VDESERIQTGEFKSFDDLLSPKLQGRIGISDPRTPGSGSSMWSYMHYIKRRRVPETIGSAEAIHHP